MTPTIREAVDPIKAVRKALKYARSISPTAETTLLYDDSLARLHALENAPANNGRSLMTEVLNLVEVCCNCLELSGNDDLKRRVTEFLSAEQPPTDRVDAERWRYTQRRGYFCVIDDDSLPRNVCVGVQGPEMTVNEAIKGDGGTLKDAIDQALSNEAGVPRGNDHEVVDIEAGARACARWRNGKQLSESAFNEMREGEKNAYRQQAKDCAEAWGLKWKI